jgi:hypothetical protein
LFVTRELGDDRLEHAGQIPQHVVVPETKHGPAVSPKVGVRRQIDVRAMVAAIDLDDQPGFDAGEVGDPGLHRDLPAELGAVEQGSAQVPPEQAFSIGGTRPELSGARPVGFGELRHRKPSP